MQLSWDQDDYVKAYRYAAEAHNGQEIKGSNLPYIMHVSLVSMEVFGALQVDPGFDGNLALQCALLHDVMEDAGKKFAEIENIFGTKVAQGVLALTKNSEITEHDARMKDSLERIQLQPREIWIVKMADRITNLQPPPRDWSEEKIAEYREEASEIYDTLQSASAFLAERLLNKIETYGKY